MNSSWNRWISRLTNPKGRSVVKRRNPQRPRLEALEDRLAPATNVWIGSVNTFWNTSGNWSLGRAPQTGDDLEFGATAAIGARATINNLPSAVTLRSITVSASGYSLSSTLTAATVGVSGSITVGANLGTVDAGTAVTMSLPVNLNPSPASPNQTFSVGLGTDLVMSGRLVGTSSNPANQTITKVGSGTLRLTNDNVGFTGAITVANSGGTLYVTHARALGGGTGITTVNPNSQLLIGSVGTINESVILNGAGVTGTGALFNLTGNNTWTGAITLDSAAAIGAAASTVLTVTGQISDTGAGYDLYKEEDGEVILARPGGNTYRGQTIINQGTLTIRDPLSLGAGANALRPENGTPQAQTVVNYNSTTQKGGTLQVEFVGLPSNDPNALLLDPTRPYDEATNPVVGFQVYNDRLILVGPGHNGQGALRNTSGDNAWNGSVTLRSPTAAQTPVVIHAAADTDLRIDGVIGAEALTASPQSLSIQETPLGKTGAGRLILTNANTYYGITSVQAGVLTLRDSGALPDNAFYLFGTLQAYGAYVSSGAAVELEVDSGFDGTALRTHGRDLGDDSVNNKGFDTRTIAGANHWIHGQEIAVPGTSGTFTVTFNGQTTAPLAFNVPATGAGSLQAALNALPSVAGLGGVTVHRSGLFYRVVWNNHARTFDPGRMTVAAAGGSGASIAPMYGLTIATPIEMSGGGVGGTGVLRSVSGINVYDTDINMGGNITIGVDADARVGHPSPDDTYFVYDHSLTIPALISGFNNLTKVGAGHLILPDANTYDGDTLIQEGWVTIRDALALGSNDSNQTVTLRNYATVADGAALHLKPQPGQSIDLNKNLNLSGLGFAHPFSRIDTVGAVENLDGVNTLSGLIRLNGVAGIGVEEVDELTADPMQYPVISQLTMTGPISDFGTTNGGITKLGSRRLIIQTPATYTGPVDIAEGVLLVQHDTALGVGSGTTTTVRDGAALELGNTVHLQNGGIQRGLGIWDEHLILNGAGNPAFADSAITVHANNGLASSPVNTPLYAAEFLWQGPVTLNNDTTATVEAGVEGERTLRIDPGVTAFTLQFYGLPATDTISTVGAPQDVASNIQDALNTVVGGGMTVSATLDGTFKITFGPTLSRFTRLALTGTVTGTGAVTAEVIGSRLVITGTIDDATNPSAAGSGLTVTGGGEIYLSGSNTYRGSTLIQEGILTIGSAQALGGAGVAERQTLAIAGDVTAFTLTFNGTVVTNPILVTGTAAANALAIQNALNALAAIGSGVTVTPLAAPGTFEVRFGGTLAGFDQLDLIGTVTGGTGSVVATESVSGAGGTVIADGASLYLAGSFTVANEPLRVNGLGGGAPPTLPLTWFQQGPATAANGQTAGNQNVAGRVTGSVVDPNDANVIYIATAGGGAWKTIDGGLSWRPMFDQVPEIQGLNISPTGTFTLTFDGATTPLINATSPPAILAADIQEALNALPTIGGVGGRVTVTDGFLYNVTFGGTLAGVDVSEIVPSAGVTVTTVQEGRLPDFAMYIGSITMDPNHSNVLYLGTGETNNSTDSFYGTGIYRSDDYGVTWYLFRGDMIQQVAIDNAAGTFTISFTAPDDTGALVTESATLNGNDLASVVEAALNGFSNIGGVGGSVSVTPAVNGAGDPVYKIQFGGTLGKQDVPTLVATGSATPTVSIAVFSNPFDGKGFSKIIIDPQSTLTSPDDPRLYMAVGEGGDGRNERQRLSLRGFNPSPGTPNTFTISFTGPDSTGAIITTTTVPISYYGNQLAQAQLTADEIKTALEALTNLGGVGGVVTVTPRRTGRFFPVYNTYDIDFSGSLAQKSLEEFTTNFFESQPGNVPPPTIDTTTPVPGGPVKVRNGSGGGAGIWRYQNGTFFLMTDIVSANRQTLNGQTNPPAPPRTPGPDDDFRVRFPDSGVGTWSDVSLVYADPRENGAGDTTDPRFYIPVPILYAALGSSEGYSGNAVYRTENPEEDAPIWYIGDHGVPVNQVETITFTTNTAIPNQQFNLLFKGAQTNNLAFPPAIDATTAEAVRAAVQAQLNALSTIGGAGGNVTVALGSQNVSTIVLTVTFGGALGLSPQPLLQSVVSNNGLTIQHRITTPGGGADTRTGGFPTGAVSGVDNGNIKISVVPPPANTPILNNVTIYASVSLPSGAMRGVFKSTDGGKTWTNVPPPQNFLQNVGNYANAIHAVNASTVYIGGTPTNAASQAAQVYVTTNGGTAWQDISVTQGNGPHVSQHSIVPDRNGNLLFGSDGGLWRLDTATNTWSNLNGNLAISQVNGVASDPTSTFTAYAGLNTNGTAQFDDSQTWTVVDKSFGGNMGGGQVFVDPTDSDIIYAVQTQIGGTAVVRRSLDGGATWTTIRQSPQVNAATLPLVLDRINTSRVLVGGGGGGTLFESTNRGNGWTALNPPIGVTAFDVASYQGTYASDPDYLNVPDKGINTYDPDTIYVTDGTSIYLTKDHAQTWVDRTGGDIAGAIIDIEVDPRNRDHVYVVRNVRGADHVYYSSDAGQTWDEIGTNNGLGKAPAWKIVLDPRNGNLYLGTDRGVYQLKGGPSAWASSNDDVGETWHLFGTGMPSVQVKDLELNQTTNTLLAGTYGRSVYTLFLDAANTTPLGTTVTAPLLAVSGTAVWAGPIIVSGDPTTGEVWIGSDGTQNLPNGLSAAQIEISGTITDLDPTNPARVVKVGPGDVILSGANDYKGVTEVREGVLVVDNLNALGDPGANTLVRDGAALELLSNLGAEPITLQGDGYRFDGHNTGSLRNVSGDNTYSGPLTLDGAFTSATIAADSGSALTLTGPIGGGGPGFTLYKELTGRVILAAANTYAGTTQVNQGALQAQHSDALNNAVVVLDGAAMELSNDAGGNPISVDAPLSLTGTGIFNGGALRNVLGDNTWAGAITLDRNAGFAPLTLPTGRVAIGSDLDHVLTIDGSIGQALASGLVKVGTGEVALAEANTYTGSTEVGAGVLTLQHNNALGARSGLNTVQEIVTYSPTGTGDFRISFNGQTSGTLAFGASALDVLGALNAVGIPAVTVVRQTLPTYDADGTVTTPAVTGYLYRITFGGSLSGTNLPLAAVGRDGTLAAASFVAAGGTDVRVFAGAELRLDGDNAPGGSLTVNRVVDLGVALNGTGTLYNATGDNTWAGLVRMVNPGTVDVEAGTQLTLDGGTAGVTMQKVGDGALVFDDLAGPTNSHSLTVVTEGDVLVTGTITDVLLDGGTLSGNGTVGFITSNFPSSGLGGIINPGDNLAGEAIGTLTSGGGVLNDTDLVFLSLGTPGDSDLLRVSGGDLDLGNAQLDGVILPTIVPGDSYTIIQTVGAGDEIFGQFAGPSTTPVAGGAYATVVYLGGKKFVADYFTDKVVLTRELVNLTGTLSSTLATSKYGERNVFTFTLVPEFAIDPIPTGTVIFTVTAPGGSPVNYPVTINPATGVATWDPVAVTGEPLQLGTYTVTASYDGVDAAAETVFNNPVTGGPMSVTVIPADTRTTLTPSANTTTYGQNLVLTATVSSLVVSPAGSTDAPGGTVTFFDGSTQLGAPQPLNASGVATLTINSLTFGGHSLKAVYNSDGTPDNYNGSSSSSYTQNILKAVTTTTVTSSLNPSAYGEAVTFTATVTPTTFGPITPAGSVTFRNGGLVIGTGTLNPNGLGGATATFTTTTPLQVGTHQITAVFTDTTNYAGSTSAVLSQTVTKSGTTTAVVSSLNPSDYGQQVTFTARVTPTITGSPAPTGTVTFMVGSVVLGTPRPVNNLGTYGEAFYTTSVFELGAGADQAITAVYNGSASYNTSTSAPLLQTVNQAATTTTVTSGLNPSTFGQAVTFTARVEGVGTPTGTVTFFAGATELGTGTLSTTSGITTAAYTTTAYQLQGGAGQTITAVYNGSTNHAGSNGTLTQTVNAASTTTAVSSSSNPAGTNESVTFTATVTSPAGGTPTGTVSFLIGAQVLGDGTRSVVGGVATWTYTAAPGDLPVGENQTVTAVYATDGNYAASTGTMAQTVAAPSATTSTVTSSANPSVFGQPVTFTATVAGGIGVPHGTVRFLVDGAEVGTATLTAGQASYTTTAPLATGNHTVTVEYLGAGLFLGSTSDPLTQTVNPAATATTVTSPVNPSNYGQAVTFTARVTVTAPGAGTPNGTVRFSIGATVLGDVGVTTTGGVTSASLTTGAFDLPVGANQTVTAEYLAGGDFAGSTGTVSHTVNPVATTVTLTTDTPRVVAGQMVSLTAQVTPAFGSPAGTVVTFFDLTTNSVLGTGTVDGAGMATANVTVTAPTGNHQIVARFAAQGNFGAAASAPVTVFVTGTRATTSVVTSSANPAYIGQPITLTATVTATGIIRVPTGTVTFYDLSTGQELGTVNLARLSTNRSRATLVTADLALGGHDIVAEYSGDRVFALGASSALTQNVNPVGTRTSTTTLAVSPVGSVFGQLIRLTARVDDTGGSPAVIPNGFVSFYSGATLIGTAPIARVNGVNRAILNTRALPVGLNDLTAVYGGNLTFAVSNSGAVNHEVNPAATSTRLTTSASRGAVTGQAVTFTATVRTVTPGSGNASGTVTFVDVNTGATIGTGTLVGNVARFTTTELLPGTYRIVALYDGDGNYQESTSNAITQIVRRTRTRIAAQFSTLVPNTPLSVTGTVSVFAPGSGIPTGTVAVFVDDILRDNVQVDPEGRFLFDMIGGLSAGRHTFRFVYSGDANYAGSVLTRSVLSTNGRLSG